MAKLCKAGQQLREQIDDDYPDRDRKSDGWIADARHLAKGNSDHIPVDGIVRAVDIDADLSAHKEEAYASGVAASVCSAFGLAGRPRLITPPFAAARAARAARRA